jgi:serine protease AprX
VEIGKGWIPAFAGMTYQGVESTRERPCVDSRMRAVRASARRRAQRCIATMGVGAALCGAMFCAMSGASAGELDPALASLAKVAPRATSAVVLELEGAQSVEHYAAQLVHLPRAQRPGRMAELMRRDFEAAAAPVMGDIRAASAFNVQMLWISHSIALSVSRGKLAGLAELPGVKRIDSDASLRSVAARHALGPTGSAARRPVPGAHQAPVVSAAAAATSLDALAQGRALNLPPHFQALDVLGAWQRGYAGQGVTVAVVDSGVDPRAPAIGQAYRGANADWFDPYAQQPYPVDASGHGTLVAGIVVGTMVHDTPIGVAPRANWIAARLFDDAGQGRASAVHRIYQWVLDPDGDPATADAPDIVNNSWGLPQSAGQCNDSFARPIAALRAADIHVVFAAGNDGPSPNTSMSPANNPGVLSVGALDAQRHVADRSSRGPSACGGGAFPSAYAPGVNLPALDRVAAATGSAALADGTSFASAAVSGALAVLRSASPQASAADIEALLLNTARREAQHAQTAASPVLSPSLTAALDGPKLTRPQTLGAPPVLRWAPQLEAGKRLEISPETLRAVLPWSLSAKSIRPQVEPAGGQLQTESGAVARWFANVTHWTYAPDGAHPATLRFDVATHQGRDLVVELSPRAPAATAPAVPRRQTVRTELNRSVQLDLAAEVRDVQTDQLRLTTPLRGGRVKHLQDGKIEYTPPPDWVGTDQFTYALRSAGDKPAPVTIVIVRVVRQ